MTPASADVSGSGPPLSAVVAAHEPTPRLPRCLESVSFADEVVLVGLGGFDEAPEIARAAGARLIDHPMVPVVEEARKAVVDRVESDWVLFVDPDEEVSPSLRADIREVLREADGDVGCVEVPWQFYFRGQRLTTTIWGASNQRKKALVHRDRVRLSSSVHRGVDLHSGYRTVRIDRAGDNVLRHYWCDSYREFFEKHDRYLRHEGESLYGQGKRFSWSELAREIVVSLGKNLLYYQGIFGGLDGLVLSFLHAWYVARRCLSLRAYEAELARESERG